MVSQTLNNFYSRHIRSLSISDRLRLLEMIARDVAEEEHIQTGGGKKGSIMNLHGLGAEIWQGVDAQAYVNELRKEWDHRP